MHLNKAVIHWNARHNWFCKTNRLIMVCSALKCILRSNIYNCYKIWHFNHSVQTKFYIELYALFLTWRNEIVIKRRYSNDKRERYINLKVRRRKQVEGLRQQLIWLLLKMHCPFIDKCPDVCLGNSEVTNCRFFMALYMHTCKCLIFTFSGVNKNEQARKQRNIWLSWTN